MTQQRNGRHMKRIKPLAQERPRRKQTIEELGRRFDDLYSQLDNQLTRMAEIQLEFDALRSKLRLL